MKTFIRHTLLSLFVSIFCFTLHAQEERSQEDFLQVITEGKMSSKDFPATMSKAEQKFTAYERGMLPTYEAILRDESLSRAIPANDDCSHAIEVWCGSTVSGSTIMSTSDTMVYDYIRGYAPGVWYKFRGNGKRATFSLSNGSTDYDARITIFEGSCGNMTFLGTNDVHYPGPVAEATINAEWGRTYYIYVSGYYDGSNVGNFEMNVDCGNFCDITLVLNPVTWCNSGGTYYLITEVKGDYLPLNGNRKIVIGGQTIQVERINQDEAHTGLENLMDLEYSPGFTADVRLPRLDKYGSNMDFFVQADNGCTWTIQNDFDSPDCNCPPGDVVLNTQQDVYNFRENYPDCTEINGNLWIEGDDIVDLSPLSNIREVEGDLPILDNALLSNVDGLSNIWRIDGYLVIYDNLQLQNLNGFSKVRSLGNFLLWRNSNLRNIDGLSSLEMVEGNVEIAQNPQLEHIRGIRNLKDVGGYFLLLTNNSMTELGASLDIESIGQTLWVQSNPLLEDVNGFENLRHIGYSLDIYGNERLKNLDGFSGLRSVGTDVYINMNPQLTNFDGLCPLFNNGYSGELYQSQNGALFNPETDCYSPENCDITGVSGHGVNCSGAGRYDLWVDFTGHDLPSNGLLEKVVMAGNTYNDVPFWSVGGGTYRFQLNNLRTYNRNNLDVFFAAVNGQCTWTARDLVDEPNCSSARMGRELETGLTLYPNPSTGKFTVISSGVDQPEIHVFNQLGQMVYSSKLDVGVEHNISLKGAKGGVYLVRLIGENYIETQKLILTK